MHKGLIGMLIGLGLLAGCNAEPTYSGVSFITYNYTPWNLEPVRISDASGNVASSSTLIPGGGAGRVSCCYTFKGTEFTVKWSGGDPDLLRKHLFDGKFDEVKFKKETAVHFPATKIPDGDGTLILELHIYPDEHMELALSRNLAGDARIPIVETTRWLYQNHRDELVDYEHSDQVNDVLSKVAKRAWMQYRIEDAEDMRGYMYLYFLVASDFDKDAEIAELLNDSNRKPGDFGRAVAALPAEKLARMKATGAPPGDKNV
ncbi:MULTISPECIES: hypothetical protein [Achromobacter]|uniref:DUF3304 domain-containing protein n=1 Tax=Achromobacter spanius TaxID=217203 RepID=A0ABY8GR63_9BURK|nr:MULTISPECIES: hypothetical protein [Achromobacter]WAI83425.1 hypothetical protein N8Z00_28695 [Achromobacter spanius]WEX93509.1 hypothetical protein N3Z32_23295 [Achromobacter sp. SS2-2022]WFP07331.1 hypothetical protein P8T11_23955 [Achromobacter spanius]